MGEVPRRTALRAFAIVAALAAAGCGVKEDVSLFVYARNATLVKGTGPFGPKLDGSVEFVFDLGAYSGEPVTVEAIQVGLYRGNQQVLPAVKIEPQTTITFPFALAPGQKTTLRYTLRREQLVDDEPTVLCAGPIVVTGAVKQAGKPEIRISSDAIAVAGC